jgi:environmental stress-induced protein Ves
VRRWFAVLGGQGVKLRIDGTIHEVRASSAPFEFDGAAQTDCELLDGATRDFNLMLRQGGARMERVSDACSKACRTSTLIALYASVHPASAAWDGECLTVPPNTLAWRILDCDGLVQLAGDDALWMEIDP